MKEIEILQGLLAEFFNYYRYPDAIKKIREKIRNNTVYRENRPAITKMIVHKQPGPGEPLNPVHISANVPLDENTDEEAYRWLDLLIRNVESSEDPQEY